VPHIRSGKLRARAVTSAERLPTLPEIPVLADFVPGYEATSWFGLGAPRDTPSEIIDKLNAEIGAALADAAIQQRVAENPVKFRKLIVKETEKCGKVIRTAHIQLD
jgi:tripartite-type tricarboxylate transporter receptor subunit TctC